MTEEDPIPQNDMFPSLPDMIGDIVEESKAKWMAKHVQNLPEIVEKLLNQNLSGQVAKVLGMDDHWGKWEIDNCNGRSGNSFIGETIKVQIADIVGPLVLDIVRDVKLTAPQIAALKKGYQETLLYQAKRIATDRASDDARALVEAAINDAIS